MFKGLVCVNNYSSGNVESNRKVKLLHTTSVLKIIRGQRSRQCSIGSALSDVVLARVDEGERVLNCAYTYGEHHWESNVTLT